MSHLSVSAFGESLLHFQVTWFIRNLFQL